jgi:16S rRNA (guanine966-N2)-methyltransferase
VPNAPGLRPTTDRVRETLFNWLAVDVPDARCLDLFAGSGALGFEAASRGAASVLMVEAQRSVAGHLRHWSEVLQAPVEVVTADAFRFLRRPAESMDIVFLDPPFGKNWVPPALALLGQGWLSVGSLVYVETERELADWPVPPAFAVRKMSQAGDVCYRLLEYLG